MSTRAVLTLVGALVTLSVSVPAAQTAQPPMQVKPQPVDETTVITLPATVITVDLQRDSPKNPYRGVLSGPPNPQPRFEIHAQPQTFMRSAEKPRVACGMVLLPANPNGDPDIVKVPDLQTEHAIRRIMPPVCLPE